MQGLIDANYKCISSEVGSYGKQSDGGIFVSSLLFHNIENCTLSIPPPKKLPNMDISVSHIVGDAANPIKNYLMKPFFRTKLVQTKSNFQWKSFSSKTPL